MTDKQTVGRQSHAERDGVVLALLGEETGESGRCAVQVGPTKHSSPPRGELAVDRRMRDMGKEKYLGME